MVWWICLPSFVDFWTQLALVLIWFCSGFALVLVWDLAKIDGIPRELGPLFWPKNFAAAPLGPCLVCMTGGFWKHFASGLDIIIGAFCSSFFTIPGSFGLPFREGNWGGLIPY
jgi:hypothetical protein